ncbi:MAG: molecular chaperone DnaK [Chloroflexota bacterium]
MSKIIGIDLGTTNSAVAVMEGNEPVVISTAEGGRLVPSFVAFNKKGERLVGQTAKRQAVVNPENTIYSIKRLMGRRLDSEETRRTTEMVPYEIVAGPQGDARVKVPVINKTFSPQEISAMILQKLKRDAEAYLGQPVTQAVITVPAYFNDSQRQATKDAGKIADLEVLRIVNEPTAAALAYGLNKKSNETVLIFDLGGGTYDVSILEIGEDVIEVKATNGDTHLGGDDWDERIVDWMVNEFKKDQGIDLRQDRQALQRLREAAEKAKVELSTLAETEVNLPFITANASGPQHLQMKLTRSKFEQLTEDLVERCRGPFENALADAGIQTPALNEVILVGGATRMPMIQDLVRSLTNKAPNQSVNPDEVVAMGAAIQAGVLGGSVRDVLLLDVTPLSLGLETLGGVMTTLIPRNTTVPTRTSENFSTAEDNQTAVDIHVLQGERPLATDNKTLGKFQLSGIPPAPRGTPQIQVTFDIDANGILNVTAQDQATGKQQKIQITASTNLSDTEVERLVQEAKQHETEDRRRRELIDVRNQADQLIYTVEKTTTELRDRLRPEDRKHVEDLLANLRQAMQNEDVSRIRMLIEQVQQATHALSQQLYQSQAQAQAGAQPGGDGGSPEEEGVVEGQFRET